MRGAEMCCGRGCKASLKPEEEEGMESGSCELFGFRMWEDGDGCKSFTQPLEQGGQQYSIQTPSLVF